MKISKLILENDIIPPNSDEADDMDSDRWDAIFKVETQVKAQQFQMFQKAGVEMDDFDGVPVIVSFDEDQGIVEVIVTVESIRVQSLIALSEVGAILPTTEISLSGGGIDITTNFPAAQTPFKVFLQT